MRCGILGGAEIFQADGAKVIAQQNALEVTLPWNDFTDFYYDGWIENLEWLTTRF